MKLNKTIVLRIYMKLPEPLQRNRLLIRLIAPMAERYRRELQQKIIQTRWQAAKLEQKLQKLRLEVRNEKRK